MYGLRITALSSSSRKEAGGSFRWRVCTRYGAARRVRVAKPTRPNMLDFDSGHHRVYDDRGILRMLGGWSM